CQQASLDFSQENFPFLLASDFRGHGGINKIDGDPRPMPPPPAGRPTKLTPELQTVFLEALRRTWYVETAAELAGVARQTVNHWLRRGRAKPRGKFGRFSSAVKAVLAEEEARHREAVAAADAWQAHAWLLERRHPQRWDAWRREFLAMRKEL